MASLIGLTVWGKKQEDRPAMAPNTRPARESDLVAADNLIVHAMNDLLNVTGSGGSPSPVHRLPGVRCMMTLKGFGFLRTTSASSASPSLRVRDDLWVLAQLFVSPDYQGGGVGTELLARTLTHAEDAQTDVHAGR